ncbi:hypothetical protein AAFC00_001704 [Neodothiora populina]|uniref:Glycosyltransferase family 25 protein n=1 Tax=Neodothiora populina TaxID=2781224 RepID=A0ABR3PQ54_9PEZI
MLLRVPPTFVLFCLGILTIVIYFHSSVSTSLTDFAAAHLTPANATLGFGGLFVVSGPGSPRREGLIESANVTGLHFRFPELPKWSDEQIAAFRNNDEKTTITNGSIRAWLSHNVVLKAFLESGLETALILEDDVDWDIRLRTIQTPIAAAGARSILPPAEERYYWGHPSDWELMYIGHCGDYFTSLDEDVGVGVVHPEDLASLAHALVPDESMPERTNIHPYTASLLTALGVPEKTRVVHRSKSPLCTFGYAVTRASAKRLIDELAPVNGQKETIPHAYDVAILTACRDKGLRCYTVNPELFHHMEGESLIGGLDKQKYRPPVDKVGSKQVYWRGETSNIGCGFWSKDFRWNGDKARLAFLREEVGNKGKCLKPGRTADGGRIEDLRTPPTIRR